MVKLSILIATNRIDSWLDEALASVGSDKFVDEIVLVLDGIAPTEEQVKNFPSKTVIVLKGESSGLAAALNLGLSQCSGTYIARLDSDDISLPARFASSLFFLDSNMTHVAVGGRACAISGDGKNLGFSLPRRVRDTPDCRALLLERNVLIHPTMTIRADSLIAIGGYDNDMKSMEDYDLWLRLAAYGEIAILPHEMLKYRIHSSQMTKYARPFGAHISKIFASRLKLAKVLGKSKTYATGYFVAWELKQIYRYSKYRLTALVSHGR